MATLASVDQHERKIYLPDSAPILEADLTTGRQPNMASPIVPTSRLLRALRQINNVHPTRRLTCPRPCNLGSLSSTRRSYHSHHHPQPPPFPPAESAILSAALVHVPRHGFTSTALSLGAKDAGYLDVSVQLFPRGVFDLINYYLVTQRLALKDTVQFSPDAKLGVGKKVRTLALERLRANVDIISHWQNVRALPTIE